MSKTKKTASSSDGDWIYVKSFIHWRTKKRVYRKNGGSFRFKRKK